MNDSESPNFLLLNFDKQELTFAKFEKHSESDRFRATHLEFLKIYMKKIKMNIIYKMNVFFIGLN